MSKATLLYDEDCGFCRWSVERIRHWDRRGSLRFVPIQSAEGAALLGDMDQERRMASWHLVDEAGEVRSGGAGIDPLFRLLPAGGPLTHGPGLPQKRGPSLPGGRRQPRPIRPDAR